MPIYINEDLIKPVADLFREARKLVKEKKLFSAWTYGGSLFVKVSGATGAHSQKITSRDDPNALFIDG